MFRLILIQQSICTNIDARLFISSHSFDILLKGFSGENNFSKKTVNAENKPGLALWSSDILLKNFVKNQIFTEKIDNTVLEKKNRDKMSDQAVVAQL